ncbi:MAG TPA: nucleoside recognition protein [Candidatus Desulfofervidus auxilii]|uniref:Nucleoside recognition protein n=1 Tax=Desulfofervidus auxilii TaxID=1621989 RepID=A0A7V0IA55_DESA2|nr:nucleoside recognition protein [Candidatus Desulfofervidus auxilii]
MKPFFIALKYLSFMIPSMAFGVILINFFISIGFLNRLTWIAKPLISFGHIRGECALSFITAFASPTAANTMLMELFRKGTISKKELFISSLINSFPAILTHGRTMLPIIIPLLGKIGLIYFSILVFIGFLKTTFTLIIAHFLLPSPFNASIEKRIPSHTSLFEAFKQSLKQSSFMLKRIMVITIPITIFTFYLIHFGFFDFLSQSFKPIMQYIPLPTEALSIIAAQFGGHIAAYTVASNLLVNGLINGREIILALLWGTVITSIVSLRYFIPYYWGIFGPRLGTQIMLLSNGTRQILIILTALSIHYWPEIIPF